MIKTKWASMFQILDETHDSLTFAFIEPRIDVLCPTKPTAADNWNQTVLSKISEQSPV